MKPSGWISFFLSTLLIIGIIWNVGSVIASQRSKYFSHTYWERFPALKDAYIHSQYVDKHAKGFIPDEAVYSYAAGEFIYGANPLYIIPDAPPLGKYLISLSILLFENEHIIIIVCSVISLFLFYILGKQIFSSTLLALIPVYLFSSELLFKNQLVYTPLFDIMQLVFLLGCFLLFNKGLAAKKIFPIFIFGAVVCLGCFISIKFFMSGITIVAAMYIVLGLRKDKKRLLSLTVLLPLAVVILLATYVRVFAYGYSLRKLIGAQKWIFLYHQGQLIKPLSIWPLLLFNKWYVWWGNKPILSDSQWTIIWPIITIPSFVTIIVYMFKKIPQNKFIEVLMVWVVCYLLFFSIGQITVRYFLILLPALYIISLYGITIFFKNIYCY